MKVHRNGFLSSIFVIITASILITCFDGDKSMRGKIVHTLGIILVASSTASMAITGIMLELERKKTKP